MRSRKPGTFVTDILSSVSLIASLVQGLLRSQAAIEIHDEATLQAAVESLLSAPEIRVAMVERGVHCLKIHRGATARTVFLLREKAFKFENPAQQHPS
jgi:3-deoxy-D-manno-octulosonic-acid transferase